MFYARQIAELGGAGAPGPWQLQIHYISQNMELSREKENWPSFGKQSTSLGPLAPEGITVDRGWLLLWPFLPSKFHSLPQCEMRLKVLAWTQALDV